MDLGVTKRKLNCYQKVYESCAMHEETMEMIVPDTSPDVVRICFSDGCAYVKEKSVHGNDVSINGVVKGALHYFAEGDSKSRKLDVLIPFLHNFEHITVNERSECVASAELINMEVREINSRKLAVRAQVAICLKVYSEQEMEFSCEIPENKKYSIELLEKSMEIYAPVVIKENSFTVVDDIEITQPGVQFDSLLNSNVQISCNEMKIIGNKAIIKGSAKIKCLYTTKDGGVSAYNYELPYSHIMDIDATDEECDLTVKLCLRAAEIEPAHDMTGDTRYLTVNILVDACAIAYIKDSINIIDDLYSTSNILDTEIEEINVNKLCEHSSKRISVNETIQTANSIKRVIDTNVVLEPCKVKENKIINDAQIKVYYIGEDDSLYCATRKCQIECATDKNGDYSYLCDTNVTGESANGVGKEISVRFFTDYDIRSIEKVKLKNIRTVKVFEKEKAEKEEASVIIKCVYSDKSLWEIAKSNNTTMEKIADANGLDIDETVAAGSMLLIPIK